MIPVRDTLANCPHCGGTLGDDGRCQYCGSKVYDLEEPDTKVKDYNNVPIYGCPRCGEIFYSDEDMTGGGICPMCGEESEKFEDANFIFKKLYI